MTDWLELILRPVIHREEEQEDLSHLLPGQIICPVRKIRQTVIPSIHEPTPIREDDAAPSRLLQAVSYGTPAAETIVRRENRPAGHGGSDTLSLLYRQTVEGAEGIRSSRNLYGTSGQEQVVVVQEAAPAGSGLTVGELDRAVRRDSRRYDGGMTIY